VIRYTTNDGHKLVEVTCLTTLEALPQTCLKVDGHVTLVVRGVDYGVTNPLTTTAL